MISRFLVLHSFVHSVPRSKAGEGSADVREQCRAAISGTYLNFMNDLDLLKISLSLVKRSGFCFEGSKDSVGERVARPRSEK